MTDVSPRFAPDPNQNDSWRAWAERLVKYLNQPANARRQLAAQPVLLSSRIGGEKAFQAGMLMFNPASKKVEFTRDGAFFPLEEEGDALQALSSSMRGKKFDYGLGNIAVGGSTINFSASFSTAPLVFTQANVNPAATAAWAIHVASITTSGFVARARRIVNGGTVEDNTVNIAWFALGD